MKSSNYQAKTLKIALKDIVIWCFSLWPLVWGLWVSFRVTDAILSSFMTIVLIGLTMLSLIQLRKLRITSFMICWSLFLLSTIVSGSRGMNYIAMLDIPVIACGFLICYCYYDREINTDIIIRCLFVCGFFVAATIMIDEITHIFSTVMLPIYTDYGRKIVSRRSGIATGGIIPHPGSAGGYLFSGLMAYIVSVKREAGKKINWFTVFFFIGALLFLQKRGFVLDTIVSLIVIWICGRNSKSELKINYNRLLRITVLMVALVCTMVIVYNSVPDIRYAVDRLVGRFTSEDETLSGRTSLYALSYSLFQTNPVWGIGWGAFRSQTVGIFRMGSSSTYEVHNVYLQLLCETGIMGLATFLLATGTVLLSGIRKYRTKINLNIRDKRFYSLQLGLFLQLFFLAYCMSGNPLYDYNYLITYFIGVLLTVTV